MSERSCSTASGRQFEDASLLAGYFLALIRSFPDCGDDIRMRLYLADMSSHAGKLPSVQFFWEAMSSTSVCTRILRASETTLDFLLQRTFFKPSTATGDDSQWDREWRTVLLFLELYTFVLRLTDDEDFFSGLTTRVAQDGASSRVR